MLFLLIAAIAFTASAVAGLLGLGGAVLAFPAYLYLPGSFGLEPLGVTDASGITSLQVLTSSLLGTWTHRHRGSVDARLAVTMGLPIMAAGFGGATLSASLDPDIILGVFASMAILGSVLMLVTTRHCDVEGPATYSAAGAVAVALFVGLLGGIVGAPGAFLLSPLMMAVLGIPTRVTIGTTLGIVLLSAIGTSAGKMLTGQVPLVETIVAVGAAVPGAYFGSRLSFVCPPVLLRRVIAGVVAAVSIQMWYRILT